MEHNTPKISKRGTFRAACLIVFVSACRFSSEPAEALSGDAAESQADLAGSTADSGDAGARATQTPAAAQSSNPAAGSSNPAAGSSNPAAGSGNPAAGSSSAPAARPPASPNANLPITAHAPPPPATKPAAGSGAPASTAQTDLDAGAQPSPDGTKPPSDLECSNDLASCLLKDPLNYAECLRINADHGCPEPDAGTSTTSPVTTEDGKPLSQACQAELANCIARNPTPESAGECTEKARKCK